MASEADLLKRLKRAVAPFSELRESAKEFWEAALSEGMTGVGLEEIVTSFEQEAAPRRVAQAEYLIGILLKEGSPTAERLARLRTLVSDAFELLGSGEFQKAIETAAWVADNIHDTFRQLRRRSRIGILVRKK